MFKRFKREVIGAGTSASTPDVMYDLVMHILLHDDFNTDKVCNSANPTQVGFVHIYEPCILVTFNAFYVTSHWESQLGTYFQNRFLRSKH